MLYGFDKKNSNWCAGFTRLRVVIVALVQALTCSTALEMPLRRSSLLLCCICVCTSHGTGQTPDTGLDHQLLQSSGNVARIFIETGEITGWRAVGDSDFSGERPLQRMSTARNIVTMSPFPFRSIKLIQFSPVSPTHLWSIVAARA